jgi:SAM-dependent methyltransferase
VTVYETRSIPVHSTLLLSTRDEAMTLSRGDLALGFCGACGFLFNRAYSDEHTEYSSRYEETQGFSRTFVEFHTDLANRLIQRFDLHGKRILEIGCGKGEFLNLLCGMGGNTGIGFDPVYVPERDTSGLGDRVTFVRELYSEEYAHEKADFVCCKMTLEHIAEPLQFVSMVRRALEGSPDTAVFFQVPDMLRILRERAFWDVYYEHCSYFTAGSLRALFLRAGFAVDDVWSEYGNQVLMIAARPASPVQAAAGEDVASTLALTRTFAAEVDRTIGQWRSRLLACQTAGRSIVIWGAGSKGVAFLTKLGGEIDVRYAVDVNPYKHGTYLAGTGQEIVGPAFLAAYRPGLVVVMNPVYVNEISEELRRQGVDTEILALT